MEYPPFGYRYAYEPSIYRRLRRSRISPFESYIANVQRQLQDILYDGLFELVQQHADANTDAEEEQKQEQEQQEQSRENQPFLFSSSVTHSRVGGKGERVEEHRERVMGRDGSVHTVTRRQIGDRWYVHESHSTKDGESSSKETWHNVPEEAIASFKKEWEDRHALKDEHDQPQPEPEPEQPQPALEEAPAAEE